MRKTHAEFVDEIKDRPFIALDSYINAVTKVRFRCIDPLCNKEWSAVPNSIQQGHGCPACAIRAATRVPLIVKDNGSWVVVDISTNNHPDSFMCLDKSDLSILDSGVCLNSSGYPSKTVGGRLVSVHRLLNPSWEMSDHIDGDKLNNRRSNLRSVTASQNRINSEPNKRNISGVRGVCFCKTSNKYLAYINADGRRFNLGRFDVINDAITARAEAEKYLHGEYARR